MTPTSLRWFYLRRSLLLLFLAAATGIVLQLVNMSVNHFDMKYKQQRLDSQMNRKPMKLIILTYMRSGSTLTGDLLQHHPDVFYTYEPLWYIQKVYELGFPFKYLNGTNVVPTNDFSSPGSLSTDIIRRVMDCQFQDVDVGSLHIKLMMRSKWTKPFYQCFKHHEKQYGVHGSLKFCLYILKGPCSNAKVTIIKTIRFSMNQVQSIMESDPNVKVIHLLRDPRGMLLSQCIIGEFQFRGLEPVSKKSCDNIVKDLEKSSRLSRKFPGRIVTIRYEDIVEFPVAAAESLLDFVGLEITDEIEKYVWNITYSGKSDSCDMCTTRANATATAYRWRFRLSMSSIGIIDNYCSSVYSRLGFKELKDVKDLESLQFASNYKTYGHGHQNIIDHWYLKNVSHKHDF